MILVTGGAGFIGSNFVHYWDKSYPDDPIRVLDKLTYAGHLESLKDIVGKPNFEFIRGDICDFDVARKAMEGVDRVVHFAAESHVDRALSGLDAVKNFFRTNVDGTVTLLYAAKEAGVSRFHQVSTDEVYGDLDYDSPYKFNEDSPHDPRNPYSVSKSAAEVMVRNFGRTEGLGITISNCTNNYGPFMTPEKMIPRSIALLTSGERIKLYTGPDGPGRQVRDWLYVEDHCEAIDYILQRGKEGETYCIGGDNELSNYLLTEKILSIMSEITGQKFTFDSNVEKVADRPSHDRRYAIDASKIKNELGWRPKFLFEPGLRSTIQWYIQGQGKDWLVALKDTSGEVRIGQNSKVERE